MAKKNYYAVARGHQVGIYRTSDECHRQVRGFPRAKAKGFSTLWEAEDFLHRHRNPPTPLCWESNNDEARPAGRREGEKAYYVVSVGTTVGMYLTKEECDEHVYRYAKATCKGFHLREEAIRHILQLRPTFEKDDCASSVVRLSTASPTSPTSDMQSPLDSWATFCEELQQLPKTLQDPSRLEDGEDAQSCSTSRSTVHVA